MSAIVVGTAVLGAFSSSQARKGANRAANAQTQANEASLAQNQAQFEASQRLTAQLTGQSLANQRHIAGMQLAAQRGIAGMQLETQRGIAGQQIAESRNQFAEVQRVLSPFITAGNQALGPLQQYQQTGLDALGGQRALIGMNGSGAQSAAIQGLENSPEMMAYMQQGENAMLQNAAATGGLRGGNTQAAMAQFRPSLLAGMISQQYDRLGGLAGVGANTSTMLYQTGQNAAAGQASAGIQVAGQVGNALSQYSQGVGNALSQYSQGVGNTYGQLADGTSAAYANQLQSGQNSLNNMGAAYNQYYNNQGAIGAGRALAGASANVQFANSLFGTLGSYTMLQALKGGGGTSNPNTAGLYSLSSGGGGTGLRYGGGTGLRVTQ